MARQHATDEQFRAVIPSHIPDRPNVFGPYPQKHTAQTQITRRRRGGTIEVGRVVWLPVDQTADAVLIPAARLARLQEAADVLGRLQAAGVDNWEGYSFAFQDDEEGDE